MTVSSTTSRNQYTATSGQTVFPYTFEIFDKGDVVVVQNTTTLSEGTNYTVSGVGADSGGNITLLVGATAGDTITVYRDMAYERTTDYQTSGDFLAQEVNDDFDRLWLAVQQNEESDDRAIRKPITDLTSINMELPAAATRANKVLSFDASGNVATIATTVGDASSITYTAGYTGSVQRTVQTKLDDTVSVKDFGAVGDGSDATAAFTAAVASGAGAIYIPAGTYKVSSTIAVDRDITIFGDGPTTKIDVSSIDGFDNVFEFAGAGGTLIESNLNSITQGTRRYTFTATHNLAANDLFCIWDDADYSYSDRRANYQKGEYLTVYDVDGSEVSFFSGFYDFYTSTSAKMYKVSTIQVNIKDFNIVGTPVNCDAIIDLLYCRDSIVENVHIEVGNTYTGIQVAKSYSISIENCTAIIGSFAPSQTNMYPFLINNSQKVRASGCEAMSLWHAFSTGGDSQGLNIVNRQILVSNCTLTSQNGTPAADFHGNTEHSMYTNCSLVGGGCLLGANYNSFVNNTVLDIVRDAAGAGPDTYNEQSFAFYGTETVGYNFIISNNTVQLYGAYYGGSGFGKFVHISKLTERCDDSSLIIADNNVVIESVTWPFGSNIIRIYDAADTTTPNNVNVTIQGNTIVNRAGTVVGAQSIFISTDNNYPAAGDDVFKSITIKDNVLDKCDINLDNAVSDLFIEGNRITGGFQGININGYKNAVIRNNIVKESYNGTLYLANGDGDYTIVTDNSFIGAWQVIAPPGPPIPSNTTAGSSCDAFISPSSNMAFNRVANNYFNTNGKANHTLIFNEAYNVQEYNNYFSGTIGAGVGGPVRYWIGDSSQYFSGLASELQREFWHVGTAQTDFAVITFDNVGVNGSAFVRLHMANNTTGYSGILEFTLEGQDGATATRSGTRYTSTNDPISGGRVLVTISTDTVTLSLDGASSAETIHCKAEIVKSCQASALKDLRVKWNV